MEFSTIAIIVVAVVLAVILAAGLSIANFSYEAFFEKYMALDKQYVSISPLEFFQHVNERHLGGKIALGKANGDAEDAYARGAIFISDRTANSWSLASLAIIAHELGHALQDQTSNKLKQLSFLRRLGRFVGFFMFPLLVAGLVMIIIGGQYLYVGIGLAAGGVFIFLLAIIIKAFTIRIENEASKNAIMFLNEVLDGKSVKKCQKLLNSARLTYWGDMFRVLLSWTFLTRKGKLFR